ncbi:hypothetical protein SAY87_018852 [Trapa incisa]|uniref:GTD-binding domain-containing protein n=1 Tax=Trapa incisa TaxID=236973 RepID=A0AAN7K2P0_9MYRT|nr:hypothetical protein SAY87_018852 [Trapa incisa]
MLWGTTALPAMEIHHLGRLCLLVTALLSLDLLSLDLYTKFSQISLTFNVSKSCSYSSKLLHKRLEVGSTFFIQFITGIVLFFVLSIGLKVLNFSFRPRSSHLRNGDSLKPESCDLMGPLERARSEFDDASAIVNGGSRFLDGSEYSKSEESVHEDQVFDEISLRGFSLGTDNFNQMERFRRPDSLMENGHLVLVNNLQSSAVSEDSETGELFPEDRTTNQMLLRELVKSERQRAEAALAELEKERSATSTAAEEAMLMILRLQAEKSSIEIEAKQYRRLAEEKQMHDQEVIRFLRSVITEQKRDLNALDDELKFCRRRLGSHGHCSCSDQTDGFEEEAENNDTSRYDGHCTIGEFFDDGLEDELISSLEFDSWAPGPGSD